MNTIKKCFNTILRGDKEKSRLAARVVRKLVYSSSASDREKYDEIAALVRTAPENYAHISEEWRQENFVMAVSVIYFLHDKEHQPDFLFPWFFQLLQHSNGYIRHAATRMVIHEIGPLTYHIRFPDEKQRYSNKLTPENADRILFSLFINLDKLMSILWQPKYEKYKYIDSLPASPYKSVQMIMFEFEDSCGRKYIMGLVRKYHKLFNGAVVGDDAFA